MNTVTANTADQIREAVKETFPFEVQKFKLSGPDNMRTSVYGLFRSDNSSFVGSSSVTKVYVPHTTEDVIALAEAGSTLFEGESEVQCHWSNGHYITIQPTKDYRHHVFGTRDTVFPRIVIRAGFDGKSFGASMGYWRDACRNLAMLRMVKGTTVNIRHTSGLTDRVADLITEFQGLSGGWYALTERMDQMEQRRVSVRDFLHEMYGDIPAEAGRKKTMHENRTRKILDRIIAERVALAKSDGYNLDKATGWELYNGVQGYEQHDAIRRVRGGGELSSMDKIIQAAAKQDVAKAEKLVFELAA